MKNLIKDFWPFILGVALVWVLFSLSGCTTLSKATRFLNDHPTEAAGYCAEKFPVTDSVGTPEIIYGQGKNEDYQPLVDSLYNGAWTLLDTNFSRRSTIMGDIGNPGDFNVRSITFPCPELDRYKAIAHQLADQIFRLNARYKPCAPDTIRLTLPVYRTNNARVYYWMGLYSGQKAKADQFQEGESKWRHRAIVAFWVIGIMVTLTALKIWLQIKGIKLPF